LSFVFGGSKPPPYKGIPSLDVARLPPFFMHFLCEKFHKRKILHGFAALKVRQTIGVFF